MTDPTPTVTPGAAPVPLVSVIICTRNNAGRLAGTLAAVGRCDAGGAASAEVVVVDNGSADDTPAVVAAAAAAGGRLPVRSVVEPRPGKGYAYNAGLAAAAGEVLLFTDDDVAPPTTWITAMVTPILSGRADAVAGSVVLGPEVSRPWMTIEHRSWLASTDRLDPANPGDVVGASMAFSRRVFERVPAFDPELGPGALGFADERLFGIQVMEAGFKIVMVSDAPVVHNCDPNRLSYRNWLDIAVRGGRSNAYVCYHWQHLAVRFVWGKQVYYRALLLLGRLLRRWHLAHPEQADPREMALVSRIAWFGQYLRMRGRPRNYDARGLVKRRGLLP